MRSRAGRLSEGTIAGFVGAAAFAVLSAGTAVAVSTTAVSITNPSTGKRAHVTNQQSLVTSERDPVSGKYAKVDANGRQVVGDGSGALTVDGTVTARTSPPKSTFTVTWEGSLMASQLTGQNSAVLPTGEVTMRMISIQVTVPAGQAVWVTLQYIDATSAQLSRYYVPLVRQGTFNSDLYVGSMPLDIWPRPGTLVSTVLGRNASTGTARINTTLSGVAF